MAKKKKTQKKKPARNKINRSEPPRLRMKDFLLIAGVLVLAGSLIYGGVRFKNYLATAPFLMVKKIKSNQRIEYKLERQNIFMVDLVKIENDISSSHPEFKSVRVSRIFPNVIDVFITEREPFFQIEQDGYFSVDREGIIISGPASAPSNDIIVYPVFAESSKRFSLGRKVKFNYFDETMNVLAQLRGYNSSKIFTIKELRVSSLNNMSFLLDKIEIRIGKGDYKQKIDTLFERVLPQFDHDLDKIEYVDLRFKEYVIGYKK